MLVMFEASGGFGVPGILGMIRYLERLGCVVRLRGLAHLDVWCAWSAQGAERLRA